ncbi:MAG TPA: protein kinase [Myxococcaceae bacterium]|nr:protein kinase [Myxococcaceae bacterium]
MSASLEYAIVFERAQGPRLAAAERLVLGWPDLFAGQLYEVDVGLRAKPQTLIAVARFEPFVPLHDVEARFAFWAEQAGGLWLSLGELGTRERANLLSRIEGAPHHARGVTPGELPRRLQALLSDLGVERTERRGTSRVRAELHLALGQDQRAVSYDISTRGLFVRSKRPPPIGDQIAVSLSLPGHPSPFVTEGRVAHHHSGDQDHPTGFGLALLAPPPEVLRALSTLVEQGGSSRTPTSGGPRRIPVALSGEASDRAPLHNLSLGGATLESDAQLSVGTRVVLELPATDGLLPLNGEVVRVDGARHAIRFSLDDSARTRLVSQLLSAPGGTPMRAATPGPGGLQARSTLCVRYATAAEIRAERLSLQQGRLFIAGSHRMRREEPVEVQLELGRHRFHVPAVVAAVERSGVTVSLLPDNATRERIDEIVQETHISSGTPVPSSADRINAFLDAPTPRPVEASDRPRVGNYELLSLLGRGGMAEVFYGRALAGPREGQYVAIKRLLPQLATDPVAIELFTGEADLSRMLVHPHIVQTFDVGTYPGGWFLVMEHVDGRDLGQLLRRCRKQGIQLPIDFAIYLARVLLDALSYAHNAKGRSGRPLEVVHCDVSPSNVFISRLGEVKLGDFGVARIRGLHAEGPLAGKPAYLSPEAMEGEVSPAADVWAAAVCLYELLTLQRPFPGKKPVEIAAAVRAGQYIPVEQVRPEVPEVLATLLSMSFTRDPALRLTSALDFSNALEPLYDPNIGTPLAIAALVRGLFGDSD